MWNCVNTLAFFPSPLRLYPSHFATSLQFEEIYLDLPRFTISFWLHPDDKLDTVKDVLVINRYGDWDLGFKVGVDSAGAITLTLDGELFSSDSGAVEPNEWNHIAIVVESPSGGKYCNWWTQECDKLGFVLSIFKSLCVSLFFIFMKRSLVQFTSLSFLFKPEKSNH